jgi:hypothetical protein
MAEGGALARTQRSEREPLALLLRERDPRPDDWLDRPLPSPRLLALMRSELRPELDPDRLELPRDVFPRDELELPRDAFELPRDELALLDAMVMVLSGKKCLGCARELFALRRLRRTLADPRSRGKRPVADRFRTTQNKMHSTTSCTTGPWCRPVRRTIESRGEARNRRDGSASGTRTPGRGTVRFNSPAGRNARLYTLLGRMGRAGRPTAARLCATATLQA